MRLLIEYHDSNILEEGIDEIVSGDKNLKTGFLWIDGGKLENMRSVR